jgi:2-polyprenyl-3-methyl-5-hydroxy-6-metoxy-1,4-benzoquinol methylase
MVDRASGSGSSGRPSRTSGRTTAADAAKDLSVRLKSSDFLSFAVSKSGLDPSRVANIVEDYTAEVAIGLDVLSGVDLAGRRCLEIGAGIGLLSICLTRAGFDVTALEPGANGFDANAVLGEAVRSWLDAQDLPILTIEAAQLDPISHGLFDVIFSMNVLEHIPDLEGAIFAMERVLAPGGLMVHLCPNYAVPYDPHFGIPLIPFAPRLTARLLPGLAENPLWTSLNFVTARRLRRCARRVGLMLIFRPGMMYDAFIRLDHDPTFSARHQGLVARIYSVLKRTGLLGLLRFVPAPMATPMALLASRGLTARDRV